MILARDIDEMLDNLRLSPSGIKSFESCRAGYLANKVIFPRTKTERAEKVTNVGKKFHKLAESSFSDEAEAEILADEEKKTIEVINDFKTILISRDYYKKPSVKEETLKVDIAGLGVLIGIPDRVIEEDGWFYIVDYKTSAFCYPDTDRRQVMSYAYMLWKVKGADPDKIMVILDYVKADNVFRYRITKADLIRHENYLISRFRAVRKLLESFKNDQDLTKVPHSPGNCNLCYMTGICLPYSVMVNPSYDPLNPKEMSTESLVRERIAREEVKKLNEERIKAINRTLMFRYENNLQEPGDSENRSYKDIIDEHLTKVQQVVEVYDTEATVETIINKGLHKMVKGTPFSELVDMKFLEKEIVKLMLGMLPVKLGRESVPDSFKKKLEDHKEKQPRAPYLRQKS